MLIRQNRHYGWRTGGQDSFSQGVLMGWIGITIISPHAISSMISRAMNNLLNYIPDCLREFYVEFNCPPIQAISLSDIQLRRQVPSPPASHAG